VCIALSVLLLLVYGDIETHPGLVCYTVCPKCNFQVHIRKKVCECGYVIHKKCGRQTGTNCGFSVLFRHSTTNACIELNVPRGCPTSDVNIELDVPRGHPTSNVNIELDVPRGHPTSDVNIELDVIRGHPTSDVDIELDVPRGHPISGFNVEFDVLSGCSSGKNGFDYQLVSQLIPLLAVLMP